MMVTASCRVRATQPPEVLDVVRRDGSPIFNTPRRDVDVVPISEERLSHVDRITPTFAEDRG